MSLMNLQTIFVTYCPTKVNIFLLSTTLFIIYYYVQFKTCLKKNTLQYVLFQPSLCSRESCTIHYTRKKTHSIRPFFYKPCLIIPYYSSENSDPYPTTRVKIKRVVARSARFLYTNLYSSLLISKIEWNKISTRKV